MSAQPLEDTTIFDLTNERVIEGPWPPAQTPAAVLANPDALQEPKRPGRPKGAKSKPKKKRAKKAKAPETKAEQPVTETQRTKENLMSAGGSAGPVMWWRRINSDGWLIIAAVVAMLALGSALPFLTGVLKP